MEVKSENYWNKKANSGFYTLIEDEMFGVGIHNIDPSSFMSQRPNTIRSFGTIWNHFPGQKVRIYLYEPLTISVKNLTRIDNQLQAAFSLHQLDNLKAPTLQHNFAEDNGLIRDQVIVSKFEDNELLIGTEYFCTKLIKEIHFDHRATTDFDLHIKIDAIKT